MIYVFTFAVFVAYGCNCIIRVLEALAIFGLKFGFALLLHLAESNDTFLFLPLNFQL